MKSVNKSWLCFYTHNEACEREFKKTIPLTIASNIVKHVGIYLTKGSERSIN